MAKKRTKQTKRGAYQAAQPAKESARKTKEMLNARAGSFPASEAERAAAAK